MNNTYADSHNSKMPNVIYESEAQRLQREADNFTKKFEHEKKRLMVLEDQHKQALDELTDRRETLRAKPSTFAMKKDQYEIKLLENRLDKALISFNDIQASNKTLRKDIDIWRKQQRN